MEIIRSQPIVNKNTHNDVILISRNSWYKPPKNVYFMVNLVHLVNNHLRKATTGSIWDNLRAQKKQNSLKKKKKLCTIFKLCWCSYNRRSQMIIYQIETRMEDHCWATFEKSQHCVKHLVPLVGTLHHLILPKVMCRQAFQIVSSAETILQFLH